MSKHLYKLPLLHSDLFVESIDTARSEITYELREKENGRLLEPKKTSQYIVEPVEQKLHFDMRFITLAQADQIVATLGS